VGDEMKEAATVVQAAAEAVPDRRRKPGGYMTFISNSRAGMKQRLRDYAELAYKMGDSPNSHRLGVSIPT